MDASLPRGCSAHKVSLQVESSGGTEVGNSFSNQGILGVLEFQSVGATRVEPVAYGKVPPADGNSKMALHVSKGATNEEFKLASSSMIGNHVAATVQNPEQRHDETLKKGRGLSSIKSSTENEAQKEDEGRNGLKVFTLSKSEVPMRQLARKGGLSKGEAAPAPKPLLSVADAVKEGILKKEREEQDRMEAIDAVMGIHWKMKEIIGYAAPFPGVAGPESGRLCQCCNKPESSKSTIFCDKCERGFHVDCVKNWPKPAQELDVWHCGPCGLQPGHYWPLGKVLISYDNAVAEYKKYSSNFLTTLQKVESSFGTFSQGVGTRTHEKSDGFESVPKVKVIRDFKKEARKGNSRVSVAITASPPVASKADPGTPMHTKEFGTTAGMPVSGETQSQSKMLGYPGFVQTHPISVFNSVAPIVSSIVSQDATAVRTLITPHAPIIASHQSRTVLPLTEYPVSCTPPVFHTECISPHGTPSKLLYTTNNDSTGPTAMKAQFEVAPGSSQYPKTLVTNQHIASSEPNILGRLNLSYAPNQTGVQQKAAPASGAVGIEISSSETLRPLAVGERLTEREELLKEAKESLNQLRTFIAALKGNLAEGWKVVLRKRPTGAQEKFYLSPAKRKYRSRQDVARFLGLVDDPKCQRTKPSNLGTSLDKLVDKQEINLPSIQASEVANLPMFCGDVMIEKLGVIDSRPTYSDEYHIWPVGFRSSWHDSETGSYCISEIEDGGVLGPIFRVTRKLAKGAADSNSSFFASSRLEKFVLDISGIPGEPAKMKIAEEKSSPPKSTSGVSGRIVDGGVFKVSAEGIQIDAQKRHSGDGRGELIKHTYELGEDDKPCNEKEEIVLLQECQEGGSRIINGDASHASSTNHNVASQSVGEVVIDPIEEKELPVKLGSDNSLDVSVSTLDVKGDFNLAETGKDVGALESLKVDSHHSKPTLVVLNLSGEEDEKSSAIVFTDKRPASVEEGIEKVSRFVPPHIKPLPYLPMNEITVEARTPGEAWKSFGKKFVEHYKNFLESEVSSSIHNIDTINGYMTSNSGTSNLGNESIDVSSPALLSQKCTDNEETTNTVFYERLEKRLGENHSGLNLPTVQNMIKALHIGKLSGHNKTWVKEVDQIVEVARTAALPSPSHAKQVAVNSSDPWKRKKRVKRTDLTAEESVKKMKRSCAEPAVPPLLQLASEEQTGVENAVFRNFPPVVAPALVPPLTPAIGSGQATEPSTTAPQVPHPVITVEEPRLPPPAGQPILKRLPSELVGDLLQVWEFLCRFSDLFGQDVHFTLEDLEAGLLDVVPVRSVEVTGKDKDWSKKCCKNEMVSTVGDSPEQSVRLGQEGERNVIDLDEPLERDPMGGDRVSDKCIVAADRRQESENSDLGQDLNAATVAQTGIKSSLSSCLEDAEGEKEFSEDLKRLGNKSEGLDASDGEPNEVKNGVEFYEQTVSRALALLAEAHIPLLKFLVSDLKFRISRGLNEDEVDEPKKRGRKRVCDLGLLPPEFSDDLPMNAVTWPEVAHRYLVAILEVKEQGEITELAPEERKKLVRYFEGDGGVMGGAVEGIVGVESDAQVLAEAEKELTLRVPKTVEKDIVIFVPQEWDVALTPINPAPRRAEGGKTGELDPLPKWVEALEPVRKMPTNLGTKLKIQVQGALDCNPPDWAKATLEWSLSKGTFKSNAAGTTKRAVLEVLAQYHGEELKAINAPRIRKVKAAPSAEHLMQRCRIVLREVSKADSKQVFNNLVGGAFPVKSSKSTVLLARPFDFRTIDARLAAGAYGGSTDAFASDMRQIWKNVEAVHKSGSAILELANHLSQLFEKLYQKQVISLIKGLAENEDKEKEKASIVHTKVDDSVRKSNSKPNTKGSGNAVDDKLGKAPLEDDSTCRACGVDEDYDSILLCDGCDAEYHIYCLVPPLERVPKGNWFCPSCVAVEEGFPETSSRGEAELAASQEEMERPVAGSILKLEYEDVNVHPVLESKPEAGRTGGVLRSGTKSETDPEDNILSEEPDTQSPAMESTVQGLLKELEEKEYWQLSLPDKLFLLKFLCDEALKTPQARAHLEKSVEVALELQHQLRDLVAERLKIVIPMDVINHPKKTDIETLHKPQTNSLSGPSLGTTQLKDGAEAVAQAPKPELHALERAEASTAATFSSLAPSSGIGIVLVGDNRSETNTQEINVEVDKVVHYLDLNVTAGKEPEHDHLRLDRNTQSASEQGHKSRESESGYLHAAIVGEGIEGDISIQPDAAPRPLNLLKRSFETTASVLSSASVSGPKNVKMAKKEDNAIQISPLSVNVAETNGSAEESSDTQTAALKVLDDRNVRIKALQSARDLDLKITKLGAKLFNLTLRREHMGSDYLGREYWALTGNDGKPWLVVADLTSTPQGQVGKVTNLDPVCQTVQLQGLGVRIPSSTLLSASKAPSEDKLQDDPEVKTVQEGIKWIYYKGDKALDELVKWLSPRDQHERVLRIAIYHWRRSLYSRHLWDTPAITTAPSNGHADTMTEPNNVINKPGTIKESPLSEEMEENSNIWSFPAAKATRLLQKRYSQSNASRSDDVSDENDPHNQKEVMDKHVRVLRRCDCLELLWTSRHHCLKCHETYESLAEFQTHSNNCPLGSKPSAEIGSKDTQPQIPAKAKKITHDSSKVAVKTKKLASFDKSSDLSQTFAKFGNATRSERVRRGLKRGSSRPIVDDDVDMEPAESMRSLTEYVENSQTQKIATPEAQELTKYTPSTGLLKALEELVDTSSLAILSQAHGQLVEPTPESREEVATFETTFTVDDFETNTSAAKFDFRREQVSDAVQLPEPEVLSANQLNLNHSNNLQNGQDNRSNNPQGNEGSISGWANDFNISDQQFRDAKLYLPQSNGSILAQNCQGSNGGWMNGLNVSSHSFSNHVLDANKLKCSNSAQGSRGNSGGWANDLNVATQPLREDASSFGYHPPAPAMISTQSGRERTSQIGFSGRDSSFTLSVQSPLAFDASHVMSSSPDYPSIAGFSSLEPSNPVASQYQQFRPPRNVLSQASVLNSNFPLSSNDANLQSVPYNQYLAPSDHTNPQQSSFQQLLSCSDTLNTSNSSHSNFLPDPENMNSIPLSYTNLLHSRDSRNPQPLLYSQYIPLLENISPSATNPSTSSFSNIISLNPSSTPYLNSNPSFNQPDSHHADLTHSNIPVHTNLNSNLNHSSRLTGLNINSSSLFPNLNSNSNLSVPEHVGMSANRNPSLCTSLNATSPLASSSSHFPLSNNVVDPEAKKFEVGRFNSNTWFDSQIPPEPSTSERPPIIPTKPTARRSSTWDYLINLPLPSSQGNERPVQMHHMRAFGDRSSPPSFDLMLNKLQHGDLNMHLVRETNGTQALDRVFDGQQVENLINNSSRHAVAMGEDSVTLDLVLEKHEQVNGVFPATGPSEVGSFPLDLMSLPEEQIEIVQGDTMDSAENRCTDGVQVVSVRAAEEKCGGDFHNDCNGAARGSCEDIVQVDCSEAHRGSCGDTSQVIPDGAHTLGRVDDLQVEAQGKSTLDTVKVEEGDVGTSSKQGAILPLPVPLAVASSGRKPVKRFLVANASVHPLIGEQKYLLKGLQISLLDMEAAMADDVLDSSRASSVRRRAWRTFVKSASCIYEVTKAIILLELMVKADCLKPNWGYWSSFTAAARSSSMSSLALRLFALDSSITYERVKAPGGEKEAIQPNKGFKAKKKKLPELPLPPPSKKKKKMK